MGFVGLQTLLSGHRSLFQRESIKGSKDGAHQPPRLRAGPLPRPASQQDLAFPPTVVGAGIKTWLYQAVPLSVIGHSFCQGS